jgi:hypothetical protein
MDSYLAFIVTAKRLSSSLVLRPAEAFRFDYSRVTSTGMAAERTMFSATGPKCSR